jgi:hypothetical protein
MTAALEMMWPLKQIFTAIQNYSYMTHNQNTQDFKAGPTGVLTTAGRLAPPLFVKAIELSPACYRVVLQQAFSGVKETKEQRSCPSMASEAAPKATSALSKRRA